MIALALLPVPLALGETWWGVMGGLIPLVGLGLIALIIWRAAQPPEDEETSEDDESR